LHPRRLLLVDSDPVVHEHLSGLLRRDGREISSVHGGRDALDRLRRGVFDLVLAGQDPNGIDTLKLLRRARAIQPRARVIVIGGADPRQAIGALRAGAYAYLHHPVPENPLTDLVQWALDASAWRQDIRVVSARPEWIALELRAKLEVVERATQFVREIVADLADGACENVAAAFRELLLNAVEHGAGLDPRKRVRAALIRTARAILVQIRDPGRGFSMNLLPHAAVCNPADAPTLHVEVRAEQGRRPGGFGILMSQHLGEELIYNERGNEVLFVKYLR
jgi:CheY-like chemotaxis protein/anti-sigma regulatory factor (Ser/Thr protein kinase)